MNTPRRILLIEPLGGAGPTPALARALHNAGAQVRQLALPGRVDAVLDAIEQGWMPVALKMPTAGTGAGGRDKDATPGSGQGGALDSHRPEDTR
ncbi:MAG: hypothetical protein ACLGIT_04900 [Gammaproteobacteria bacterium]|uniref:hypothetical protein n=1 Tax=Azohydromonas sp. TaxID=1872666 RepID=UPI002CF60927|nr:hypothetical protein [Azohydromonas sp.]HMM86588.1 hypothetical protein [Azohydromonas sp.]